MNLPTTLPVVDLHCDLLAYLAHAPHPSVSKVEDIGAALPFLQAGNVKMQVTAIFCLTKPQSVAYADKQLEAYDRLVNEEPFCKPKVLEAGINLQDSTDIVLLPAIENASGFCEESEALQVGFNRLERIHQRLGKIAYISLTHHLANRFGGGNYTQGIGLKADGEALLDFVSDKDIAIDLSHTSDALAEEILNYTAKQNLTIPIIASHSNFRSICQDERNLPDEFVQELIHRKGLIGINFLRKYVDNDEPFKLLEHIQYGLQMGAEDQLAMGADFFYLHSFPDPSRYPLFHPVHENASVYPVLFKQWKEAGISEEHLQKMAFGNAVQFFNKLLFEN